MDEYETYKLTMNAETEQFGFSEFDELPEDGEFEDVDVDELSFDYEDQLELLEDEE
jgi:hypothetical protein